MRLFIHYVIYDLNLYEFLAYECQKVLFLKKVVLCYRDCFIKIILKVCMYLHDEKS